MRYTVLGTLIDETGRVAGVARLKTASGLRAIDALFDVRLTLPATRADIDRSDHHGHDPLRLFPKEDAQPYIRDPRSHVHAARERAPRPRAATAVTHPGSWSCQALALDKHDVDPQAVLACMQSLRILSPQVLIDRHGPDRCLRVLRACAVKRNVSSPAAWVLCALAGKWDVDEQPSTRCRRGDSNSHSTNVELGPEPSYTPRRDPRSSS